MSILSPVKFDTLVNEVTDALPKRTKTVIVRRFGLKNGKYETLDAIGKDYGITRERVRQIENDGLKQFSREEILSRLAPAFQYLNDHFSQHGHVRSEERILTHLSGEEHPHPRRQAVFFVLTIGEPFSREVESDDYHTHWMTQEEAQKRAKDLIAHLVSKLEASVGRVWSEEELLGSAASWGGLERNVAESYLDLSKKIQRNVFGEYGLSHWPEVSPRGVRDKAYLVMKREGKPLHFSDITGHINQANFSDRKAYVQTVHNELIKDKRFVLVGRGLYALAEWGYTPGTVHRVLIEVLRNRGPLAKEEVLGETLKRRLVRPNTVLLNLQTSPSFKRLEDGRYALVE